MSLQSKSINRIVFINPQDQLGTIGGDGQNPRLLTPVGPTFQFPAWSPDGNYLAVLGDYGDGMGVYLTRDSSSSTEPQPLFHSATQLPVYVYWASDSRRISFIASHPQDGVGLYVTGADRQKARLLTVGQPLFWDWTPESGQILFHSGVNSPDARLALIDLERGEVGANIARPGLFQAPSIAPSGQYWAFADVDEYDNGQLIVENIQTQEQIAVPHEGAVALNWSPVQDHLAFISPQVPVHRYYGPLQLLETDRKSVRTLVDTSVLAFFWAPDGRHIAYFTLADTPRRVGPAKSAADGQHNGRYRKNGQDRLLQSETESNLPLDILTLEIRLLNVVTGYQHKLATFEPSPLFINQVLPFFDQYALSHRLWSPNSDALVLPVLDGQRTLVTVFPIDGSSAKAIGEGKIAFWSWQ